MTSDVNTLFLQHRSLLSRHPPDVIAFLAKPLPALGGLTGEVRGSEFLRHVRAVAKLLPAQCSHALNLCEDRYLLLVSFCAVVLRGQTNLLPPNTTVATQQSLLSRYPSTFVIHDGVGSLSNVPTVDLGRQVIHSPVEDGEEDFATPLVDPDHVAALMFTSGSTGQSKPILKSWRTLVDSTIRNVSYFFPDLSTRLYLLATVPARHMWGFETSLLPALFSNVSLVNLQPLFPLDVQDALRKLAPACVFITSPIHLRALTASQADFPPVARVLCATAALPAPLAKEAEHRFSAPLSEVFGCSEIGSMAHRETVRETSWQPFEHISFCQDESGATCVSSTCVLEPTILGDRIELLEDGRFRLLGRTSDQIKIAGKRASLEELNQCLLQLPDLEDGIIFEPPARDSLAGEPRLAAMVVSSKGISAHAVTTYLRNVLDPAFVPRPILFVERLPRSDNGKLSRDALVTHYEKAIQARSWPGTSR